MKFLFTIIFFLSAVPSWGQIHKNMIGIDLIEIPSGYFWMGSEGKGENYDEAPVHKVHITNPFRMGVTEITNTQYETFDPSHAKYRGIHGLSANDDDAAIYISYNDAMAFCKWLSEKEGKTYRLPTEAEWEYACRAGTYSPYYTGDYLSGAFIKNQKLYRDIVPVSLQVGKTPPNAFGLYDMHGNVEEWCLDWYAPYPNIRETTNPLGAMDGLYRVTRGGSHGTPVQFLRSANRMAMIPEDKHWLTGFRIVQSDYPLDGEYSNPTPKPDCMLNVSQDSYLWNINKEPIFKEPTSYVKKPDCCSHTPFYNHNHCPTITWCDNGDLLAVWFSADQENGREMVILGSRLQKGNAEWDKASLFFKVPDRNMTGSTLFNTGDSLLFINGVEAAGDWQNLAMIQQSSTDNGLTWSKPRLIAPEHTKRHQIISGTIKTKQGWLIQAADASPESNGGTAIHISKDGGKTWNDPNSGIPNNFKEGGQGSNIAGIHAGIVELKNGGLMALGRGDAIKNRDGLERMPMSVSKDMGKTWTYKASEFPPIDGGQRLVLMRLNEGQLLLISFTHHPYRLKNNGEKGMLFKDKNGNDYIGYGMYAALSYDEGKTWPVKKLLTDGKERLLYGQAWTCYFLMDKLNAEPRGYLAATQSPDNIIHLLSSGIHYQFNLNWLLE